ncbi:hypothetical protein [Aliarcobacter butzleri]|uniref:hypothetical protein n=1 Tax=Aliarcobacter butzleri TaxID=28197 RepID=UPI001EDC85AA|nr:hypothetical protein [Aliarcobacter butzleri]MCG3684071.1 hypothetical protein [Aliarcobacter butzleri]
MIEITEDINIQDFYECILGSHWQKLAQLQELIKTSNGSQLRLKSVSDRKRELHNIEKKKEYMEFLFEDYLIIPDWYKIQYAKYKE